MRQDHRMFRPTVGVALAALLWGTAMPMAEGVQLAPPPLPQPGQGRPDLSQGDPPARVGRVARLTGTVSFHNQGDTDWTAASVNFPVSSGTSFWTEPAAEASLEIGNSRIVLAGNTEFDLTNLDASGLQAVAAQGEVYIHLRGITSTDAWSVQTPRGMVRLAGQGRYQIIVGAVDRPTSVTVVDGSAEIDGLGVSLQIGGSQTATITGTDSFTANLGPASRDGFLTASLDAERPTPTVPVPPQVVTLPGGDDLLRSGSWAEAPSYGQVWYPPVSAGWVPYREGHWAYVAPWGWTWIDDAPWGFAPFHYGRWIQIGPRWAWTPGVVVSAGPPVYAPALVTFLGVGIGLGVALVSRPIGWVPLGPREQFHPWYHASDRYVREVNVNHVTNISRQVTINNFVNRSAATTIPAAAMIGSQPVGSVAHPVSPQEFATARPIIGQQPIRPAASTAGITPAMAGRMNLAPTAAFHPAPGPAISSRTENGAGFARPAIAPAQISPTTAHSGQPLPLAIRPGTTPIGPRPNAPEIPHSMPPVTNGPIAPVGVPRSALQTSPLQAVPPGTHSDLPHVVSQTSHPGLPPTPHAELPQIHTPASRPEAQPIFVPPPHANAPAMMPPMAHPEPPRFVAPLQHPALPNVVTQPPRVEPLHFAAPAAPPRPEPQHFAVPAPQPQHIAPPTPVRAEAPQHQKKPGER
jgi:hypothetical protein